MNDICTRYGTVDFRDEIYIRNGSKSISGSIFCPHAKPENRLRVSIVFMTDMKLIRAFRDCAIELKHLVAEEVLAAVMLKVCTLQQPVSTQPSNRPPSSEARWFTPLA